MHYSDLSQLLDHEATATIGSCFGEEHGCMFVSSNDGDSACPIQKHYSADASDC